MGNGKGPLVLGLLALVGGAALIGWALARGEAELHLVVIIPVISGGGAIFAGGVVLFMVGLFVTFFAMALRQAEAMAGEAGTAPPQTGHGQAQPQGAPAPRGGTEFGGVIFIGPVPIVFGKGQRTSRWMLVGSIVFGILMIVFLVGLFI